MEFVRIRVADTGHGMTPEILARATEPFYSTKPLGKGTGLGLSQVYGIVQQSGGLLRIDSHPGEGTCVDILLPAVSERETAARPDEGARSTPAGSRSARILLLDDDPSVREFLSDALTELGHKVILAASGEEAFACLQLWKPDLALIDYAMPDMHGADVARTIRTMLPDLPIVFVTGYAETGQLEAALGPDAPVLRKPFTIEELAYVVDELLGHPA
jgi:CheY-like chemotaxis protein